VATSASSFSDPPARSNVNSVWGALTMEVLARLGLETAVISPGSRSTPLTVAAARNPKLEAIPVLDERSAAFFALGLAKRTRKPVALVCTSGTAAANYFPAVVEASMSGTPLLILTTDRPPELRECHSGQTIDQLKLFGDYARAFHDLALPDLGLLRYLRQTLVHAVDRTVHVDPGPVHLNFPFRDPLAPEPGAEAVIDASAMEDAATVTVRISESVTAGAALDTVAVERMASHGRGLIVVGAMRPFESDEAFADSVAMLSSKLGWPVLADALNPLRGHAGEFSTMVTHYDALLRDPALAGELAPDAVLQIGGLPTSKVLRAWLERVDPVSFLLVDRPGNTDPLHRVGTPLNGTAHLLAESLGRQSVDEAWAARWSEVEIKTAGEIDARMEAEEGLFEGKIAWLLSRHLPVGAAVFLANSMTVRYAEAFWKAGGRANPVFCNRGANGIDGTLSTAIGCAHRGKPGVALCGELAFLHDANGLLAAGEFQGGLTVIVVNNRGGGIFEFLPVASLEPPFERFFATPQSASIAGLCDAHGVAFRRVESWGALIECIERLPESGIRVIEIETDRKADPLTLTRIIHGN